MRRPRENDEQVNSKRRAPPDSETLRVLVKEAREQASHYPFPKSFVAPAGITLERLRYAKRVYEKTAK